MLTGYNKMEEDILQKNHIELLKYGFWTEEPKSILYFSIERTYKKEIVKIWSIIDVLIYSKIILIKWQKRDTPLSEKQYKEKYL